jgi:hypothetical protein
LLFNQFGWFPKFSEAIEFCNQNLKGELCILSNLDIYFDHTLRELIRTYMDGKFLCLSRYILFSSSST